MTDNQLIEIAIQGHASTRDAIRYAIRQEREECAKVADRHSTCLNDTPNVIAVAIRARGNT